VGAAQDGPLDAPASSFFALDQPNVVLQTIKRADFGDRADTILRVREIAGRETRAVRLLTPFGLRAARLATLAEAGLPEELPTNPLTFAVRPWQMLTIRVRFAERAR
jgi:alpha-mannosidase